MPPPSFTAGRLHVTRAPATTQDSALVLLTVNSQRDSKLTGNGVALFGLANSADKRNAVSVGWKGVDATAVGAHRMATPASSA